MNRFFSFLFGVVAGAVVGSTLALLFAPSSGRTLQEQMTELVDRVSGEVRDAANQRRNELEIELNRMRQTKFKLE
jgi:gas vesicle protein